MAEYLSKAMAFAQDAAKLSVRLSEGLVDNALDFGLDTPGSFYDHAEFRLGQTRRELNSGSEKERLAAMKRLLACVAKGYDVSEYFADVVKNVATGSLEKRRLVYMFLLRYAEQEQDLALLSVNTFQRDVADSDAEIRAMALRVMSSIRVQAIGAVVTVAVRRLAGDSSPHVRRTAALAVPKLLRLDAGLREELQAVVNSMLGEGSALAVGAVAKAFRTVSPQQLPHAHAHFRRWCAQLGDADEWGQLELVRLLAAYARTQFARPVEGSRLDTDHTLLLQAVAPLLHSRNRAVVMGACAAVSHLAPESQLHLVAKPLVRVMRGSRESAYVALTAVLQVAQRHPQVFYPHVRSFFVAAADAPFVRRVKLQVLAELAAAETAPAMVGEVAAYTQSPLLDVAEGAVRVLLRCAQRVRSATVDCFQSLLLLAGNDQRPPVCAAAMRAVRALLLDGTLRDADSRAMTLYDILCFVARSLDKFTADGARSCVFALVADFAESRFGSQHALDVLRAGIRGFGQEGLEAKMQILELSTRLYLCAQKESDGVLAEALKPHCEYLQQLHAHVFTLARYDVSFQVRDRARCLRALAPLAGYDDALVETASHVVEAGLELLGSSATSNPPACTSKHSTGYTLGSLSQAVGREVSGYEPLADWPENPPKNVDRGPQVSVLAAAASHAQPIAVAGISGRAGRADAGYSTPRSTADDDDLDAFLDSADDQPAKRIVQAQRSAVVFEQMYSSSSVDSSETESESENESEPESESESESSDAESEAESETTSLRPENNSDSDRTSGSSHSDAGLLANDQHASADLIQTQQQQQQQQPLLEDTSKYWQ
ncbi:AP-3 complex subunit beta [Coemansia sp. RSA 1085]|nr:adaptin N terminal region-domain-containing protein [Coemansia mojavensis]KAJ2677272.1 AP-3 complex subunit beta [Coemansia sp. RSA 1085]